MSETTPISAVVVNYNGGERVTRCVEALVAQSDPPAEIIVVDSGSSDGSPERLGAAFPDVRLHSLGANRGPAAARNAGLQVALNELALLVDHDVYLESRGLERLLARYRAEGPAIVVPRIVHYPDVGRIQCDGAAPHFVGTLRLLHAGCPVKTAPDRGAVVGGGISACLLVERSTVLAAGGFDEDYFFYFEDLEFSIRLRLLGHRFVCEPQALACHDRGAGTAGLSYRGDGPYPARRFYLTTRNRLMTILIHYRLRTLALLIPVLATYELATLTLAIARGWGRQWLAAWLWLARQRGSIWRKRDSMQESRTTRDRDVLWGGPLPLAPGVVRSSASRALVSLMSVCFNVYWRATLWLMG